LTSTGRAENNYTTTTFLEIEVVEDEKDVQKQMIQHLIFKPTAAPTAVTTFNKVPSKEIEKVFDDLFK